MKKTLLLFLALLPLYACQITAPENDDRYFMSGGQMANLITFGELKDAQDNTYLIWHVPGYVSPIRVGNLCHEKAWETLNDYADSSYYHEYHFSAKTCLIEGAYEECLRNFACKNTLEAWAQNFKSAAVATEKGLIGSTFAYPRALISSTVQTFFYVPVGLVGATLCTAFSPLYYVYMIASPIVAAPVYSVSGLAVTTSGYVWNTIIAPPTALISRRPTPERVDNYYVVMIPSKATRLATEKKEKLTQEKLEQVVSLMKQKTVPFNELDEKLQKELRLIHSKQERNRLKAIEAIQNDKQIDKHLTELANENIKLNYTQIYNLSKAKGCSTFEENIISIIYKKYQKIKKDKGSEHVKGNERFNPIATPVHEIKEKR